MTVVIDPGHGGEGASGDPGAPGVCGVPEKDIVLPVARRLHELLPGSILTRDDASMSLARRADFANQVGADYFISIHCNGHPDPIAEGIETFYNEGSKAGHALATAIQDSMMLTFSDHVDRGVKTKNLHVLRETKMPAVLVELEFISCPKWCQWLTLPDIQGQYAQAIARGLRRVAGIPEPTAEGESGIGEELREIANMLTEVLERLDRLENRFL